MYFIKDEYKNKIMIQTLDGEVVSLTGKEVSNRKTIATPNKPSVKVNVRACDQKDWKNLLDNENKYGKYSHIIGVKDVDDKVKSNK